MWKGSAQKESIFICQRFRWPKFYINQSADPIFKNIRASLPQKDIWNLLQARLYDRSSVPNECPFVHWQLWSPISPRFQLRTTLYFLWSGRIFLGYEIIPKERLAKKLLGSIMKNISIKAGLSKSNTNQRVRVTVISELIEQCFSSDEIATHMWHISEALQEESCLGLLKVV